MMNTLIEFKNQFSLWIGRASARPGSMRGAIHGASTGSLPARTAIGGYTAPMSD
jgi:hypothetical protein